MKVKFDGVKLLLQCETEIEVDLLESVGVNHVACFHVESDPKKCYLSIERKPEE